MRSPPVLLGAVRYAIRAGFPARRHWPRLQGLSREEVRLLGKSWYHDWTPLGFKTPQRREVMRKNQVAKQPELFRLIDRAIEVCRKTGSSVSALELFCADGFFGNYAAARGASSVLGVDLSERHLQQARLATKLLGAGDRVRFEKRDVFEVDGSFDLVLCAGGLYHLSNPEVLLARLRQRVRSALVVQTVYSLARSEPDYFETPAPGWTWGCRFSLGFFAPMLERAGFAIVEQSTNELPGNSRPEDRGSVYALCVPR